MPWNHCLGFTACFTHCYLFSWTFNTKNAWLMNWSWKIAAADLTGGLLLFGIHSHLLASSEQIWGGLGADGFRFGTNGFRTNRYGFGTNEFGFGSSGFGFGLRNIGFRRNGFRFGSNS